MKPTIWEFISWKIDEGVKKTWYVAIQIEQIHSIVKSKHGSIQIVTISGEIWPFDGYCFDYVVSLWRNGSAFQEPPFSDDDWRTRP